MVLDDLITVIAETASAYLRHAAAAIERFGAQMHLWWEPRRHEVLALYEHMSVEEQQRVLSLEDLYRAFEPADA